MEKYWVLPLTKLWREIFDPAAQTFINSNVSYIRRYKLFDVDAKRIKNPLYGLLVYLNKHDENSLNNEKLHFLFKNLPTHFKKLKKRGTG
jgi:hypothetical protein